VSAEIANGAEQWPEHRARAAMTELVWWAR
jgi:hypothetical protein